MDLTGYANTTSTTPTPPTPPPPHRNDLPVLPRADRVPVRSP